MKEEQKKISKEIEEDETIVENTNVEVGKEEENPGIGYEININLE